MTMENPPCEDVFPIEHGDWNQCQGCRLAKKAIPWILGIHGVFQTTPGC